jgi:hypothetical protein
MFVPDYGHRAPQILGIFQVIGTPFVSHNEPLRVGLQVVSRLAGSHQRK